MAGDVSAELVNVGRSRWDDVVEMIRSVRARPSFAWAIGGPFAMLSTSLVTNAVVSRALGPAGFGPYAVATAVATLLGIALGAGMPSTLVRYTAGLRSSEGRVAVSGIVWRIVALSALIVGVSFVALALWQSGSLHSWIPQGTSVWILAAGVGAMLAEMAAAERQSALRFFELFVTNASLALSRLAGAGAGILFAGPTVGAAVAGYGIGSLASGIGLAWFARRGTIAQSSRKEIEERARWRSLLMFGLPVMMSAYIVATISYLDTLVLAKVLPPIELGRYAAGARLTIIHSMLISGITTIALPIAARATATGQATRFFRRALFVGLLAAFVAAAMAFVAGGPLIRFVYGAGYDTSAAVFAILTVGLALNFSGNPLSQILYAAGRPRFLLLIHCSQLVALVIALPIAAHSGGAILVAGAWSAVNLLAVLAIIARARAVSREKSDSSHGTSAQVQR